MNGQNTNINQAPAQPSYWFVVREDQGNVVLNSRPLHPPHIIDPGTQYIVTTGPERQFTTAAEPIVEPPSHVIEEIVPQEPSDSGVAFSWDRFKISLLLSLSSDNKYKNFDPNKDKQMWNEIAPIIGATPQQCYKKYCSLKNVFIRIFRMKLQGKQVKWPFFSLCDEAFKKYKYITPEIFDTWDENKVFKLLTLYIEAMEKNEIKNNRNLWQHIANELGTSSQNCSAKFKSLKNNYERIVQRTRETGKTIKWPYLPYFYSISRKCIPGRWNDDKIKLLLETFIERIPSFVSYKFKKKIFWKEIAQVVGESPIHCDKKYRNLKLTYLKLKNMEESRLRPMKWRYYKYFEKISEAFDELDKYENGSKKLYSFGRYKQEEYVVKLLNFYKENKDNFNAPHVKKRQLWKKLASQLKMCPDVLDKKFRNLKSTYLRLVQFKKQTNKKIEWPYFSFFEEIYADTDINDIKFKRNINPSQRKAEDLINLHSEAKGMGNFEQLVEVVEDSNRIQRERNDILRALLNNYQRSLS